MTRDENACPPVVLSAKDHDLLTGLAEVTLRHAPQVAYLSFRPARDAGRPRAVRR